MPAAVWERAKRRVVSAGLEGPRQEAGGGRGGVPPEVTACCSLQVQAEIKRKWRSWKVNRYFAVDFKHRHPSLASSGVNGGTQLSILSKSSSQIRMSGLPADNLAT